MIHLCPDELLVLPAALVIARGTWHLLRTLWCETRHHHRWDHPAAGENWQLYCDRCRRVIPIDGGDGVA